MGLFDGFLNSIFTDNLTGWMGETYTELEISIGQLFGHKGKMLRNVYLPKNDGTTTEIDVLYITQKGIFVIESKNLSGWIFGDEYSQYWTVCLPNKQKYRLYNPIKQNQAHIRWLANYLKDNSIPLFSVIAFSERCTLKKVPNLVSTPIVKRDELNYAIKRIWDRSASVLSEEKVLYVWKKLSLLTNVNSSVKATHVNNIKNKY